MAGEVGLRERKKLQQRERLADVAAALFAERGYDEVSVGDVARAADVSDQTVYNYFPTKPDFVLDRADEFCEQYGRVVRDRPAGTSPAAVLQALVLEDIGRYRDADLRQARGEFPALCVESAVLRRFALQFRERQTVVVADAILETTPALNPLVVRAHAAALIAVVQTTIDRIGARILDGDVSTAAADAMQRDARVALDDLDRHFISLIAAPAVDIEPSR